MPIGGGPRYVIARHGCGVINRAEQRSCSGLVFDTARKQYFPLNVVFRLEVMVREFVFLGAVAWVSGWANLVLI